MSRNRAWWKRAPQHDDIVECVVFLSDIRYFEAMNEVQAGFFPQDKPARSTIRARLGRPEMSVEIEAVAYGGIGKASLSKFRQAWTKFFAV